MAEPLTAFQVWWSTPGVSEFVSAILGAVVGAGFSGVISWLLQRDAFKEDRKARAAEKKAHDRALLLQTLYACLRAASDLYKFAESARDAAARLQKLEQPNVTGLSASWAAVVPLVNIPEPVHIDPAAVTVLVDHRQANLAMKVLDAQAIHRASLNLWEAFGDSKRRFGEKVSVKSKNGITYSAFSQADVERLYPHLKEMSDMADGIIETAEQYSRDARIATESLNAFIQQMTGDVLDLQWLETADSPD